MRFNALNREEAIALAGLEAVQQVEAEDCDFTNRVADSDFEEFSASVKFTDDRGNEKTLIVYYYQPKDVVKECEDLSNLKWEPVCYEIVD